MLQVLAEVGPEGLPIAEMTRRINDTGLRDFNHTKQVGGGGPRPWGRPHTHGVRMWFL